MTSLTAKTILKNYFTTAWLPANPAVPFFDLEDYLNISDIPAANDVNTFLALDFPPSEETRISIGFISKDRETGTVIVHCLAPNGFPATTGEILADSVRTLLRWQRLGNLYITDVNTPSVSRWGDWVDFSFAVNFYMD